jgi:ribonuclease E
MTEKNKKTTPEETDSPEKPKSKQSTRKPRKPTKPAAAKSKPRPRKAASKKSVPKKKVTAEPADTPAEPEAAKKKEEAKQPAKASAAKRKPRPRKTAPKKSAPKKTVTAEPADTPAKPEAAEKKEDAKQPAKASATKRKPRPRKTAPKKSEPKKAAAAEPTDSTAQPEVAEKKEESKQAVTSSAAGRGKSRQQKSAPKKPGKGGHAPSKKTSPQTRTTQKESTSIKLLINADDPEEARIVLLENGKVESFHIETVSRAQAKSNIYKGRISSIEPNLQAVFVEMGTGKNGFLPFSDIHPEYYCKEVPSGTHWKRLDLQEVVKKGQEVLVQVVKEATGNKGASMTTYLSMPGRYVVLMPGSDSHGISRQITDESRRSKLREIMVAGKLPEEIGYIVRTASKDVTKTAMVKDIGYQLNLWKEIKKRGQSLPTPSLIYKEQDVISRFLRDHFYPEITEILVDSTEIFTQVENFLALLPARQRTTKVKLHQGARPIFNLYQIEDQIESMFQPEVRLPSGGSIVINPTEALVAIDVNSGRTSKDKNFEETIFLANMEAADGPPA